jgi:hypothetical protein
MLDGGTVVRRKVCFSCGEEYLWKSLEWHSVVTLRSDCVLISHVLCPIQPSCLL